MRKCRRCFTDTIKWNLGLVVLHRGNKVGFRLAKKAIMCRELYRLGRCCKALILFKNGGGLRRLRYG